MGGPAPADLIAALAPLIDREVDLVQPDKVVRIELFLDRAAVSAIAPEEMVWVRRPSPGVATPGGPS